MTYQSTTKPLTRSCSECGNEIAAYDVGYVDDATLLAFGVADTLCERCMRDQQDGTLTDEQRRVRIQSTRDAMRRRLERRSRYER